VTYIPPLPLPAAPWVARAACINADPETFFPPGKANVPGWDTGAKAVCARCPVVAECLAHALTDPRVQGVWGGTNEAERREMRRK
jgi:WhiB family redox-sensing transcriptional regulator